MKIRDIKEYILHFFTGLVKAKQLSFIGNMNILEITIILLSMVFPLLLIKVNLYFYITFICIYISVYLSYRDKNKLSSKKKSVIQRAILIGANVIQILAALILIIAFTINYTYKIQLFLIVLFVLSLFIYLGIVLVFVLYILNYLFFAILKTVFPNESHNSSKTEFISLRELSMHMTLETQIIYLLITLIHLTLYFCFVLYILFYLITIDNTINGEEYFVDLVEWITKNEVISFGNSIGLVSVILTIISITTPNQIKLYKNAKTEFENSDLK